MVNRNLVQPKTPRTRKKSSRSVGARTWLAESGTPLHARQARSAGRDENEHDLVSRLQIGHPKTTFYDFTGRFVP
jgi:hypothetical protein